MNVQDLKIGLAELKILCITIRNLMAMHEPKSTAEITNLLNSYESILEIDSISEAVKIFQKCFNWENEKDHEKNRVEVREKMETNISQNDAQKLDANIKIANCWFNMETIGGYSAFYLSICWDETTQKNNSDPILFDKLSTFDLKTGIKSEQLLFAICMSAAFHLITVNKLILIKSFKLTFTYIRTNYWM